MKISSLSVLLCLGFLSVSTAYLAMETSVFYDSNGERHLSFSSSTPKRLHASRAQKKKGVAAEHGSSSLFRWTAGESDKSSHADLPQLCKREQEEGDSEHYFRSNGWQSNAYFCGNLAESSPQGSGATLRAARQPQPAQAPLANRPTLQGQTFAALALEGDYSVGASIGSSKGRQFVANGVDPNNLISSNRFYDNGKGYYFSRQDFPIYKNANSLYQANGNSYAFLGDLASRLDSSASGSNVFTPLTKDAQTCWYNVASNQIQYWQSYYGVFYRGTGTALPYGYTYDKNYISDLAGTQSLKVDMYFYDSWDNVAGNGAEAFNWYFSGIKPSNKNVSQNGGFFKDYYANDGSSYQAILFNNDPELSKYSNVRSASMESLRNELFLALGISATGDQLKQSIVGQIAGINILQTGQNTGHALTCYGFTLNDSGNLRSLYVTNSDDGLYELFELFVAMRDTDHIGVYSDEACQTDFSYAGMNWNISGVTYINTSEELQQMYQDYNSNDLVWNGGNSSWSADMANNASTDSLPDSSSGWDVYAGSGDKADYYHSYYEGGRNITFNDHASNGSITVKGSIDIGKLTLDNASTAYVFSGSNSAAINSESISKSGSATAEFRNTTLTSRENLQIQGGSLVLAQGSSLSAANGSIAAKTSLAFASGSSAVFSGTLQLDNGAALRAEGSGNSLSFGSLTVGSNCSFELTLSSLNIDNALMSFTGNSFNSSGSVLLNIAGTDLAVGTSYKLFTFSDGLINSSNFNSLFSCYTGSLSYTGNTLTLTYAQEKENVWNSGSGTWNSSSWNHLSTTADNGKAIFSETGATSNANITISGTVSPNSIHIQGGTYTFTGTGSIAEKAGLELSNNASLTATMDLGTQNIVLKDNSSFSYTRKNSSEIASLEMSSGSTANFTGSGNSYSIHQAPKLKGAISVSGGASLTFNAYTDTQIGGTLTADSSSELIFRNSSAAKDISYDVTSLSASKLEISNAADTRGTTLSIHHDFSGTATIAEKGVLSLSGNAFSGKALGNGVVRVEKGADIVFAANADGINLGNNKLEVLGNASAGSQTAALTKLLPNELSVQDSGTLKLYVDAESKYNSSNAATIVPMEISKLSMNGGSMESCFIWTNGSYYPGYNNIDGLMHIGELYIGKDGGTLRNSVNAYYTTKKLEAELGTLKGNGKLSLVAGIGNNNFFKLGDCSSFSGDVELLTESRSYLPSAHPASVLQLGGNELIGSVRLSSPSGLETYRDTALELSADAGIGGLDADASNAYLYGGSMQTAAAASGQTLRDVATISSERKTLRITSNDDHNIAGTILGGVNLEKSGKGKQSFSGDNSGFNGSLSITGGSLSMAGDITAQSLQMYCGTELDIGGTLKVQGSLEIIQPESAQNLSSMLAAASVDLKEVSMGETVTSINGNLDLTETTSLTLNSRLDLGNHQLLLGSGTPIALHYTLQPDYTTLALANYKLNIISGVSQLQLDNVSQSANWNAAATEFFTGFGITEATRIVYDGGNIMLEGLFIPEPATGTLSLLALAALVSRRRRK